MSSAFLCTSYFLEYLAAGWLRSFLILLLEVIDSGGSLLPISFLQMYSIISSAVVSIGFLYNFACTSLSCSQYLTASVSSSSLLSCVGYIQSEKGVLILDTYSSIGSFPFCFIYLDFVSCSVPISLIWPDPLLECL